MGSNRFYIRLLVYCVLIFVSAFLFFLFLSVRNQPATAAGMALIAVILLFRLIYYVNRSNRILSAFLVYMREKDPSLTYSVRYVDKNFRGLNESLEKLIREFKTNRLELEIQAQYLDAILGNISTGILCFDESGRVQILNKAAQDLLGTGPVRELKELDQVIPGLDSRILNLQSGHELSEEIRSRGKKRHLSVHCSRIKQAGRTTHIISLNDISKQMDEQEISSWKKLIRVINHEVMNSMTPILTLATAIRNKLTKIKTPEALEDAVHSAGIIEERSSGLVGFIERYKKLTGLPTPQMERFQAGELIAKIQKLYGASMKKLGIQLICQSDCSIELEADKQMMEQVLINLVQNAAEAIRSSRDPEIELSCHGASENQVWIVVRDNGEGIPAEKMEQVFVPFFTTRDKGSGIGLSLSKQIILQMGGDIMLTTGKDEQTTFSIMLNCEHLPQQN